MPAALNPFLTMDGLCSMYLYNDAIHSAPSGLRILSRRSTGLFCAPSSCTHTCFAYHSLNFLRKKSLAALLTLRSSGCSLSVQFGGISTTLALCLSRRRSKGGVHCALELSKISKAGYSLLSFNSLLFSSIYGKMIFSK